MLNPTSTKAVLAWSPPRQRASVVGLKQVGLPFGGALGAALLPVLGLPLGWRAAVALSAGLLLITAVVCVFVYVETAPHPCPSPQGGGDFQSNRSWGRQLKLRARRRA